MSGGRTRASGIVRIMRKPTSHLGGSLRAVEFAQAELHLKIRDKLEELKAAETNLAAIAAGGGS